MTNRPLSIIELVFDISRLLLEVLTKNPTRAASTTSEMVMAIINSMIVNPPAGPLRRVRRQADCGGCSTMASVQRRDVAYGRHRTSAEITPPPSSPRTALQAPA